MFFSQTICQHIPFASDMSTSRIEQFFEYSVVILKTFPAIWIYSKNSFHTQTHKFLDLKHTFDT